MVVEETQVPSHFLFLGDQGILEHHRAAHLFCSAWKGLLFALFLHFYFLFETIIFTAQGVNFFRSLLELVKSLLELEFHLSDDVSLLSLDEGMGFDLFFVLVN